MKANHNLVFLLFFGFVLFQISVVQRMKANHNGRQIFYHFRRVVPNISCSKNESKSQLSKLMAFALNSCSKYQLFKEWKQITTPRPANCPNGCCSKYQLFKEWKQITTLKHGHIKSLRLFQISVVQRMKANHNAVLIPLISSVVVPNISCSKNESKSQHNVGDGGRVGSCSKYQLFKEWKQITTAIARYPMLD